MGVEQRFCKKCLLRELDEAEYFKSLYAYIARIPEEEKVPEDIYEGRLAACKACEKLVSGMCRICGCYVELRAAMKVRACPDYTPHWEKYQDGSSD